MFFSRKNIYYAINLMKTEIYKLIVEQQTPARPIGVGATNLKTTKAGTL